MRHHDGSADLVSSLVLFLLFITRRFFRSKCAAMSGEQTLTLTSQGIDSLTVNQSKETINTLCPSPHHSPLGKSRENRNDDRDYDSFRFRPRNYRRTHASRDEASVTRVAPVDRRYPRRVFTAGTITLLARFLGCICWRMLHRVPWHSQYFLELAHSSP